jgi:hypothetical protein
MRHMPLQAIWRSPLKTEAAMTYSSLRPERLILSEPTDRRVARNVNAWDWIITILTSPDLIAIVAICALGLLVTLALFFLVPSSRELSVSIQQLL